MENIKYGQITDFTHFLIENTYKDKSNLVFVDATAGNGFDTLFLCSLVKNNGFVYAFDIQENAINRTKRLLENIPYSNYKFIIDSHEKVLEYIGDNKIDAAIFNLGYLPNSNKEVKTNPETTINAIRNIITRLNKNGRIFICVYIMHDNGEEARNVLNFVSSLNKKEYNVIQVKLLNKEKFPPELLIIEKN